MSLDRRRMSVVVGSYVMVEETRPLLVSATLEALLSDLRGVESTFSIGLDFLIQRLLVCESWGAVYDECYDMLRYDDDCTRFIKALMDDVDDLADDCEAFHAIMSMRRAIVKGL